MLYTHTLISVIALVKKQHLKFVVGLCYKEYKVTAALMHDLKVLSHAETPYFVRSTSSAYIQPIFIGASALESPNECDIRDYNTSVRARISVDPRHNITASLFFYLRVILFPPRRACLREFL